MRKRYRILLSVVLVSFIAASVLFWLFERGANDRIGSYWDAVWWWVVTSTTVGYGDVVAATAAGRVVSIFSIIVGFYSYTTLVAMIAESVHAFAERKERGTARVDASDHVVICEITAVADELIQSLPRVERFRDRKIVIVTSLVPRNPYPEHIFIQGVPINPDSLKRACIERAAFVFVFANLRFVDPDLKTLHVASRVRKLNPKATVFVEMADPGNDLLEVARQGVRDEAGSTGGLVCMDSRKLIEAVLRGEPIDPTDWM